jgi:DNA-binding transcriptional LysR family regulator
MVLSERVANLFEDHVDAAIRLGELPDGSLVATRIGGIRRVTCASRVFLETHGTPKKPAELSDYDCVTFEALSAPQSWVFEAIKGAVRVTVHSRLAVNTAEAAIDAAVRGVGITRVLSYQIADAERAGTLVRVLRSFEPSPTPVNCCTAVSSHYRSSSARSSTSPCHASKRT